MHDVDEMTGKQPTGAFGGGRRGGVDGEFDPDREFGSMMTGLGFFKRTALIASCDGLGFIGGLLSAILLQAETT